MKLTSERKEAMAKVKGQTDKRKRRVKAEQLSQSEKKQLTANELRKIKGGTAGHISAAKLVC